MRKRIFSLLLCAALVGGVGSMSVSAAQIDVNDPGIISPYYLYTNKILVSLSISGGKASLSGNIDGLANVTKIEYIVYLQEKSGSNWSNVDSWDGSKNGRSATYSLSSTGLTSSKTYRTKTVAKVYNGSKSETITAYSTEKKA